MLNRKNRNAINFQATYCKSIQFKKIFTFNLIIVLRLNDEFFEQ